MILESPRYDGPVLGLPEHAVTITNSERTEFSCDRRWWLRYPEGLRPAGTAAPLRYGTAWHSVMEAYHRWLRDRDADWQFGTALFVCGECGGTGRIAVTGTLPGLATSTAPCAGCEGTGAGPVERARMRWCALRDAKVIDADECEHDVKRLQRAAEGYAVTYGFRRDPDWRVVGVELAAARAIVDPRTGAPYCPETYVVTRPGRPARLARTGEAGGNVRLPDGYALQSVRWPVYVSSRLDLIWRHRREPILAVGEAKSSDDPIGYALGLRVDTQVATYGWVLAGAVESHPDAFGGPARVACCWYDIASSHLQRDPEHLKGRPTKAIPVPPVTLSLAKNRTVPSWRFRAEVNRLGLAWTPEMYAYVSWLGANVDPKLYARHFPSYGADDMRAAGAELFGAAVKIAAARRAAARAESFDDVHVAFPRNPVCRSGGRGCAYTNPCASDSPEARAGYLDRGDHTEADEPGPNTTTTDPRKDDIPW